MLHMYEMFYGLFRIIELQREGPETFLLSDIVKKTFGFDWFD